MIPVQSCSDCHEPIWPNEYRAENKETGEALHDGCWEERLWKGLRPEQEDDGEGGYTTGGWEDSLIGTRLTSVS